jgi:putative hydrolase of the HAD superfamily
MSTRARAVIFDLDDTLYPERRYALSGFRHVALTLSASARVDASRAFAVLVGCLRRGERANALQTLCRALGHSAEPVPALVDLIRGHLPSLHLPRSSGRALEGLRGGWRLGIVTNGFPGVQRRKVAALGVDRLVDTIVIAYEHGTGLGKPDPETFRVAAERLGVEPARCVFVGDDPRRDIDGARAVGMRTIRILRGAYRSSTYPPGQEADAVAATIEDVVRLAPALLRENNSRCA